MDASPVTSWLDLPAPVARPSTPDQRWMKRIAGIVVRLAALLGAAWLMYAQEDRRRATATLAVAAIVTSVALVSPRAASLLDSLFLWAGRALAWLLAVVVAVLVDAVFAVPARLVALLRRRWAITWLPRAASTTWSARGCEAAQRLGARSGFGGEVLVPVEVPRGWFAMLRSAAPALLVVALVADLGGGVAVNQWLRRGPGDGSSTYAISSATPPGPPGTEQPSGDTRSSSPAFANSPWAASYFRELRSQGYEAVPYVGARYRDRSGRYLNIRDNVRVSYVTGRGPVVWFFGGSTVFGEGQRDGHTIPSEVARLAEADGHPIQVVNFGVQADSNFQSMLRLEEALATRKPRPDLVVFYDGANEISQHLTQPATDQPQLYQGPGGPSSPDAGDNVFDAWHRTSVIARLFGRRLPQADDRPAPDDVLVRQITGVYRRGMALARSMTTDAGAAFASFFQPAGLYDQVPFIDQIRDRLPNGTVDVSHVLDGPGRDTFIDPVHTNEQGARLVAESMYPQLRALIAQKSP